MNMPVNARVVVHRLLDHFSTAEHAPLTGEEYHRIEAALKRSGVTCARDRYEAHRIRNTMKNLLKAI